MSLFVDDLNRDDSPPIAGGGRASTATPRDLPYLTVKWLARLMAGESNCLYSTWFRAHHKGFAKAPSDFNMAKWQMDHTRMALRLREEFDPNVYRILIESQAKFTMTGKGFVMTGKPDLVVIGPNDSGLCVYDCKTGKPRVSDQVQVMIYMYGFREYRERGVPVTGCVLYPDSRVVIPETAVDDDFVDNLGEWIFRVITPRAGLQVPSSQECAFCDITRADCAERME